MAQLDMWQYLQTLPKLLKFAGQVNVAWHKTTHTFVIGLTFFAQNDEKTAIVDADGVASDLDVIEFYDEILVYDKTRTDVTFNDDNYLACLPYAGKSGWSMQYCQAVVKALQELVVAGQNQLNEFLTDPDSTEFCLQFDQTKIEQIAQSLPEDKTAVKYPRF